jgi:hypothetical protein
MSCKLLSNFEIEDFLTNDPLFGGSFSKDMLPFPPQPKFYILNLDKSTGPGTHWVLLYNVRPSHVIYFDSFGMPPPRIVNKYMNQTGKRIVINKVNLQNIKSNCCGWYCLYVATNLRASPRESLQSILRAFTCKTNNNDDMMYDYEKGMGRLKP